MFDIKLIGWKEIEVALKELGKMGGRDADAMRNALAAGARLTRDAAKRELKNTGIKTLTGRLEKGIRVKKDRYRKRNQVSVRVVSSDQKSWWFEFGTGPRYRGLRGKKRERAVLATRLSRLGSSGYTGQIKPYGFMRKAINSTKLEAENKIKKSAWRIIQRRVRRLRKNVAAK